MGKHKISTMHLEEMLAGCDGVTEGPWGRSGVQYKHLDEHGPFLGAGPVGANIFFSPIGWMGNLQAACIRDLNHIARCDPDTIRLILEELIERRRKDG